MRLRTILLATTLSLGFGSAFGQSGEGVRRPDAVPLPAAKPVKRAVASFWTSPEPTFDEGTRDRINEALLSYSAIEVRGGWPQMAKVTLEPGAKGPDVTKLRARLAITEDLPPELADGDTYDMMLTEAVKRFQIRHGCRKPGPSVRRPSRRSTCRSANASVSLRPRSTGSTARTSSSASATWW
jgi:hypothetical protein